MQQAVTRMTLAALLIAALSACGTTAPASVVGLRRVVGTDLIGARGATAEDQRKIDRTAVGICAGGVWTKTECALHGQRGGNGTAE